MAKGSGSLACRKKEGLVKLGLVWALAVVPACAAPAGQRPGAEPTASVQIALRAPSTAVSAPAVEVSGLPPAALRAVRDAALTPEEWSEWFRVSVASTTEDAWTQPGVLGGYTVTDDTIRFSPLFGFDPGRSYLVVFDASRLPARVDQGHDRWPARALHATVGESAPDPSPATTVLQVYPSADVVPENLLRLYIHFSAPMGLRGGLNYIHLLDADGREVEDPFLPLDVALWNEDRTRYTLLFDPGRVKRGILPHEEVGQPLFEGRMYTLVIDGAWADANGRALVESFRRAFRVGPADHHAIDPAGWHVSTPGAGTREPVVVSLPKPLDFALLQRAVVILTAEDHVLDGVVTIGETETRWSFTPQVVWETQPYRVVALPVLEDPAGNRVGRSFETTSSEPLPVSAATPRATANLSFLPSQATH